LSRPPLRSFLLLASFFARHLRRGHPFRHLGYERVKTDVRAALHRRASKQERREVSRAGWGTGFLWRLYLWTDTKRQNWLSLLKTVNYRESSEIFQRDQRPVETRDLIRRMSLADHSGAHLASTAHCAFGINGGVRRNDYRLGAASGRPGALLRTRRPSHTLL
jgi:hypothetical protein